MNKTLSFYDYKIEKDLNPNRPYGEIFDCAWNNSEAGIKYNRNKKIVVKTFQITGICLLTYLLVSNASQLTTYAMDIVDTRLLKIDNPELYTKLEGVAKIFKENSRGLSVEQQQKMLDAVMTKSLNTEEVQVLAKCMEGMNIKEVLNFFKCL